MGQLENNAGGEKQSAPKKEKGNMFENSRRGEIEEEETGGENDEPASHFSPLSNLTS